MNGDVIEIARACNGSRELGWVGGEKRALGGRARYASVGEEWSGRTGWRREWGEGRMIDEGEMGSGWVDVDRWTAGGGWLNTGICS